MSCPQLETWALCWSEGRCSRVVSHEILSLTSFVSSWFCELILFLLLRYSHLFALRIISNIINRCDMVSLGILDPISPSGLLLLHCCDTLEVFVCVAVVSYYLILKPYRIFSGCDGSCNLVYILLCH